MAVKKDASRRKLSVGDTVESWTVMGEMRKEGRANVFPCRCACGTERTVAAISLWNGNSLSCGCKRSEAQPKVEEDVIVPDHLLPVFDLISRGRLPPADGMAAQGHDPTWNLRSIAKLIGVSENQLIRHLNASPPRFADELSLSE